MLQDIQNSASSPIKQFVKFKPEELQSALCDVRSNIYDNLKINKNISRSWTWQKNRGNCKINLVYFIRKTNYSFIKISDFHPESHSCVYTCSCKTEQDMMFVHKEQRN